MTCTMASKIKYELVCHAFTAGTVFCLLWSGNALIAQLGERQTEDFMPVLGQTQVKITNLKVRCSIKVQK